MREEFQNFGLADYTLGWLAILTARKVLPVCELIWKQVQKERPVLTPDGFNLLLKNIQDKEIEFSEETRKSYQGNQFWNNEPEVRPQELLQVGESLLQHKLTFEEAEKQYEILSYEYEGLSRRVTYEVDYALGAVDAAVDFIINGVKGRNLTQAGIRQDADFFVIAALEAFTALDKNPPGAHSGEIPEYVMDELILTKRSPTIEEINQLLSEPLIPIEYDLEKRLQFWEWWLTEAIPQAWELAQE
ncbi:MAG TPA: hypothetical protein VH186_10205 [Chloroflexia bacterium]|nr:hypothetical protein [Chloroflexia bacterium]